VKNRRPGGLQPQLRGKFELPNRLSFLRSSTVPLRSVIPSSVAGRALVRLQMNFPQGVCAI
jgi:hypothetical protein